MDGSDAARGSYAHVGVAYHMLSPQYGGAEASGGSVGGPKQTQGPPGANLFVYHLPPQLRDGDLRELFRTFGNILSAKVYTDRRTDESKGFGGWGMPSHSCHVHSCLTPCRLRLQGS
jgi:hypothetical protein